MSKGYLAIIVSAPINNRYENIQNHHITMAFGIHDDDELVKFWEYREVWVLFQTEYYNKDVQAVSVLVPGVPIQNENPHITISCAAGISPVASNKMLASSERQEGVILSELHPYVKGEVRFVPFK